MIKKLSFPRREDWVASLVVFIIAMPLSLGIAIASGCSPAAGLITAIVGGIVAGALAGAPLAVTGPAAGLTALVFQIVQEHGVAGLAFITLLCGLLQALMGALKAGKVFTLIPKPVLEGVLSAIGAIIVLGQLHVLAGAPIPGGALRSLLGLPASLGAALGGEHAALVAPALLCGAAALLVQVVWMRHVARRVPWLPAALPAVALVTLLGSPWEMPRVELTPLYPVARDALERFSSLQWVPALAGYLAPAIGLAVVASAESLLTARAVDMLVASRGAAPCDLNRELIAQGMANAVSGLVGGLPVTGVMVRSAANVAAGGRTRWSTILHGTWIAAFVGLLPFVLTRIPLSALAAVLILTGIRLVNLPHLLEACRKNRVEGGLWVFTALAVCATDLLKGLLIALGAHAVLHRRAILAALAARFRLMRDEASTEAAQ